MCNSVGNLRNNLYGIRGGFIGLGLSLKTFKCEVNIF